MRRTAILASLCCAILSSSCSRDTGKGGSATPEPQFDSPVLAVVGDRRITLNDFEAELRRRSHGDPLTYAQEPQRQKLLQELVRFQVMLAKAKAAGYDRDPEIQSRVDQFVVARFQEDAWSKRASPAAPGEAEALAFYRQHREQYATPSAIRVALIYFKGSSKATDAKRAELKQKAETVLAEAQATDTAGFRRLVAQHSDDQSTRYAGGDTGWLQENGGATHWDSALLRAALAISKPDAFAPLLETPEGFYIVRLLEQKAGGVRSFEAVKDAIAYQLAEQGRYQRQQDLFDEMKQGLKVEMYPEALKLLPSPQRAAESTPPPMPRS